jgi:hypothetical protein
VASAFFRSRSNFNVKIALSLHFVISDANADLSGGDRITMRGIERDASSLENEGQFLLSEFLY